MAEAAAAVQWPRPPVHPPPQLPDEMEQAAQAEQEVRPSRPRPARHLKRVCPVESADSVLLEVEEEQK